MLKADLINRVLQELTFSSTLSGPKSEWAFLVWSVNLTQVIAISPCLSTNS